MARRQADHDAHISTGARRLAQARSLRRCHRPEVSFRDCLKLLMVPPRCARPAETTAPKRDSNLPLPLPPFHFDLQRETDESRAPMVDLSPSLLTSFLLSLSDRLASWERGEPLSMIFSWQCALLEVEPKGQDRQAEASRASRLSEAINTDRLHVNRICASGSMVDLLGYAASIRSPGDIPHADHATAAVRCDIEPNILFSALWIFCTYSAGSISPRHVAADQRWCGFWHYGSWLTPNRVAPLGGLPRQSATAAGFS